MNTVRVMISVVPFAFWGIYLFSKLPDRDQAFFAVYPLVTVSLAFLFFAGPINLWRVDVSPHSYLARVQQLKSGETAGPSKDFTAPGLMIGASLFTSDQDTAVILISAAVLASSLIIFFLGLRLGTPQSALLAQYLFLLCFNYHNRDNLYNPMIISFTISLLALYFFLAALEKKSGFWLILGGLFWGAAAALFPASLIFPLAGIIILHYGDRQPPAPYLLLSAVIFSFLFVYIAGLRAIPEAGIYSGWRLPLNPGEAWHRLRRFVWFKKILIAIMLAVVIERYNKTDPVINFCLSGLVLLGVGGLFVANIDYSQLLFAIPLMVLPVAAWWAEAAADKPVSILIILTLIIVNLSPRFIDLF